MVLPQPEPVVMPGGKVADVQMGPGEICDLRFLPLREEPIGDATLIKTSMVRECRPPAREPASSWLARRSTMATSTPASANSPASISPVGPRPRSRHGHPAWSSNASVARKGGFQPNRVPTNRRARIDFAPANSCSFRLESGGLVHRRHGVMFVRDTPVAIDLRSPIVSLNRKPSLSAGLLGRVRSAPHDGDREGDVRARGNGEFPKVEGRTGLVVTEKQIPGLFVSFNAPALKRWRQIEHHDVLLVVCKNGGEIVPADGVRPSPREGL